MAETVYRLATYKSGIDEYTCQDIANIINNLSKVGLTSKDLYFNGNMSFIEEVVTLINDILNSEINKSGYNFDSQGIVNTLLGLGKIGYKFYDFKESNIIPNLLKKFNRIHKNKSVLDYLILMKGLVATVYNIKQDNLYEEQKQGLDELKETISGDVE